MRDQTITTIRDARHLIGNWTERWTQQLTDEETDRAARDLVKHIGGYGHAVTEENAATFDLDSFQGDPTPTRDHLMAVRIPTPMHDEIARAAREDERTIAATIRLAIREFLDRRKK